jgi:hypothetical protein
MPLNDKKIISIILEQGASVPERCPGYREEVMDVIADIINYERAHRVEATNIQKKINDKCDAAARFLTEKRDGTSAEVES